MKNKEDTLAVNLSSGTHCAPAGPLGGVMQRAGQHIMDSTTHNFGPLVVTAANFAGPLDGPSDVNMRTACRGYGHDGTSQGF